MLLSNYVLEHEMRTFMGRFDVPVLDMLLSLENTVHEMTKLQDELEIIKIHITIRATTKK